jgi:hypothetical protein
MRRRSLVILILTALMLLAMSISLAWSASQTAATPTFSVKERDAITAFYKHLMGTLAPGSINRTPFSPSIEKALVAGSHVPMQLEKEMMPLPNELESQLILLTGDYRRFRLGPHVLIVRTADLWIADIMKNAGMTK